MLGFDEAGRNAIRIADRYAETHDAEAVVVRDLLGRNAIAVHGPDTPELDQVRDALRQECGLFASSIPVILLDEMFNPDLITASRDRLPAPFSLTDSGRVTVIERGTVGADWLNPTARSAQSSTRVTLYGFKGGVGRSTATVALARRLAMDGKVVLVVDLDLESPGVSTMLAPNPETDLPTHGIVDHLVEYPVGNADELDLVVRSTALGDLGGNGEVWLSAAAGRAGDSGYLDKLSRAYSDIPGSIKASRDALRFGERLEAAVAACEAQVAAISVRPDVVLLDSRSGIHDIAAVAITQLSALSLLFATDNPQTWRGYGQLFGRWAGRLGSELRSDLRGRLKIVATLVPQKDTAIYLDTFTDRAQSCFAETLYDNEQPGLDEDEAFNFATDDDQAPHYPIPIFHNNDLVGVVPGVDDRWQTAESLESTYGRFLDGATALIGGLLDGES